MLLHWKNKALRMFGVEVQQEGYEIYTVLSKYAHKLSQAPKPKVEVIILKEPKSVPLTDLSFQKKK